MNFVHGRPFMKKNIIISATSGSNKWDRSDRYSTVILCKAEKKTTSWASPSVAKKRTLKLPVPSLTVNLSMETYGSMWKLCGSWVLECAQCPQNCMPKNTFSDHGRWLRHFLCVPWVNWRGWIIKMGVLGYEGSIVSSISLCPFVRGQNAYFFSSPFTIVRIEYCACCHEYLRVLSVTQCPATLPCSSAVRGQPGQGASLLCESGFSWLVSTEVVPPLVPATAGCWEMFHYLGDSEALSSLVRLIISADYTCIVHLAMMSWMSHRQVRKLAILGFFPICWSHEPMFFLCMHLSCANTPGKETQSSKAKKAKRENQTS